MTRAQNKRERYRDYIVTKLLMSKQFFLPNLFECKTHKLEEKIKKKLPLKIRTIQVLSIIQMT